MMNYNLTLANEFIGTLTTVNKTSVEDVEVKLLELDKASSKKLAKILESNNVTRDNQELFAKSILINNSQKETFEKGQSDLKKIGDSYVMLATSSRNPLHFKACLQTMVKGSDGYDHACRILIGNMTFDLRNSDIQIDEDDVEYKRVPIIVYPNGVYNWSIITDEEDDI